MTKENVFQVFLALAILPSHLFLTEEHQEVAVRYAYRAFILILKSCWFKPGAFWGESSISVLSLTS